MKKNPAPAKVAKKVEKILKDPVPKKGKTLTKEKIENIKAEIKFVSFTLGATIPTQSFGNVITQIVIEAPTYEEAVDFAVPKIESLYKHFAEVKPRFLSTVTEVEKKVIVTSAPEAPANNPAGPSTATTPGAAAPQSLAATVPETERPAPFLKAHKAVTLAASHDALDVISKQIENSVKIAPSDKPELLALVQTRKNELPF